MDEQFWISQGFAIAALCFAAVSYFCKKRKVLFLLQTLGNLVLIFSYVFLDETFGFIGTAIATVRTGVFTLFGFKEKDVPWWLVGVMICAMLAGVIISYKTPFDVLYFVGLVVMTCSMKLKNYVGLKSGLCLANAIYVAYDFCVSNNASGVLHVVEFIAALVAVVTTVKMKNVGKSSARG